MEKKKNEEVEGGEEVLVEKVLEEQEEKEGEEEREEEEKDGEEGRGLNRKDKYNVKRKIQIPSFSLLLSESLACVNS